MSCPLLVFYNCCKWIQLNFKNPTPEHYYAWCDGIQMSRDLNISLLLNCFYLTEYCQVSALNLIGIGHSNVFFFISFIPLLSNVCVWHLALYKFLIYCNVIYFFSQVLCAMSSYFIFFHKTWQNAPVFKLIVSVCLMNYVVKGLYLHFKKSLLSFVRNSLCKEG